MCTALDCGPRKNAPVGDGKKKISSAATSNLPRTLHMSSPASQHRQHGVDGLCSSPPPSPPLHFHHTTSSTLSVPPPSLRSPISPPLSYIAGAWADIESCHALFEPDGTPKTVKKSQFPRSQSFSPRSQQPPDGIWDVVIVGAGCIGACVARELSKNHLHVLLLDSADDVTQGATKGNSGIVHAGYDDKPGTNRAKYCWKGNQMFAAMDDDLHFGFQKNGSLVIALDEKEELELGNLLQRGATNGVKNLRILTREEVCAPECLCPRTHAMSYHIDANPLFRCSLWNPRSTPRLGLRCASSTSLCVFL
jgi:hypothetical protein